MQRWSGSYIKGYTVECLVVKEKKYVGAALNVRENFAFQERGVWCKNIISEPVNTSTYWVFF